MRKSSVAFLITGIGLMTVMLLLAACGSRLTVARRSTFPFPSEGPSASQSRIVFIRPPQHAGPGNYAVSIWVDNRLVAFIRSGQKAYVDLEPGRHTLLGVAKNADVVEATLEPGRTYYVHTRLVSYYWGISVFLDPLYQTHENWPLLRSWLDETTLTELIPAEAAQWDQRHRDDNVRRMERHSSVPDSERKYILPDFGI